MKKILAMLLALFLCLGFAGCSDSKETTAKVDELTDLVSELEDENRALTNKLNSAEQKINELQSEKDAAEAEVAHADSYTEDELSAIECILVFCKILKNPDSLQIHSINYRKWPDGASTVQMDYSAQNGFGGSDRNTVYIEKDASGNIDPLLQFEDEIQQIYALGWSPYFSAELDEKKIEEKVKQ